MYFNRSCMTMEEQHKWGAGGNSILLRNGRRGSVLCYIALQKKMGGSGKGLNWALSRMAQNTINVVTSYQNSISLQMCTDGHVQNLKVGLENINSHQSLTAPSLARGHGKRYIANNYSSVQNLQGRFLIVVLLHTTSFSAFPFSACSSVHICNGIELWYDAKKVRWL